MPETAGRWKPKEEILLETWEDSRYTQTWQRPVTTCVCKPEDANTVRAPDDEWYATRNMLSLQWTLE